MANIRKRNGKNGVTYQARVYANGVARTSSFSTKKEAERWVHETKLSSSVSSERVFQPSKATFGDMARLYRERVIAKKDYKSRNKEKSLSVAEKLFGELTLNRFTRKLIVSRFEERYAETSASDTRAAFLQFRMVWRRFAEDFGLDTYLADKAGEILKNDGTIAPAKARTRVLSADEQNWLRDYFNAQKSIAMPMADMMDFSILTCLRANELVKLRRSDLTVSNRPRILVRDRKHPTKKTGHDLSLPLLGDTLVILQRQPVNPNNPDLFFPFYSTSLSKSMRSACNACADYDLSDVVWHTLRHTGITRLFEAGWTAAQVKQVSGHETIRMLADYEKSDTDAVFDLPIT